MEDPTTMESVQKVAHISKRDPLIDILKGIGIVSVVIGHAGVLFPGGEYIPSVMFVYSYHLMLFFFTAGAVFSPEKYSDPFAYIGRQLKGGVPQYWIYNFAFLAMHNVFSNAGLLDIPAFSLNDFVIKLSGVITLTHVEQLAGAMWFVPVLLWAKLLFAVVFQTAEKCPGKLFVHILAVAACAAFGLYTNYWGMFFSYHIQTAFLGFPIIYLGFLFSRYRNRIHKYLNVFTCMGSAALIIWIIKMGIGYVELSINQIISPYLFYPVTVLGLIFAVSLAKVLQRIKILEKIFSYLGSISFHIMALHFLVFKCFDWVYGLIAGRDTFPVTGCPTSLPNNGLVYSVIGVALPALAVYCFRKCAKKVSTVKTEYRG